MLLAQPPLSNEPLAEARLRTEGSKRCASTLHHIPFQDVPRQIATLVQALNNGGALLVHEMGELREPEQRNVPWKLEDLYALFETPLLKTNPRSTMSRKGIPLSNVLVERGGASGNLLGDLQRNVRAVWTQMKERTLGDTSALYARAHSMASLARATTTCITRNVPSCQDRGGAEAARNGLTFSIT